jgi:hypothetical protein
MIQKIYIDEEERKYLVRLLSAELKIKNDRVLHAISHSTEIHDPEYDMAHELIEKIWNWNPKKDNENEAD